MCVQHFLIADCRLPEVRDDPELPDLVVRELPADGEQVVAIRRIAAAPFVYAIGPSELCGCYFTYDTPAHRSRLAGSDGEAPPSGEELRIAEWLFRQGRNSVQSLGRYLDRHAGTADLAVYVCWERDEGHPVVHRQTVAPDFFGGERFERLEENGVYSVRRSVD